jgi:hypothetical protein
LLVQLQTAQSRHLYIGYHARNFGPASGRQELLRSGEHDRPIAERPDKSAYRLAHRLVIVDNCD